MSVAMAEPAIRVIPIRDPRCPCCLTPTLEQRGTSFKQGPGHELVYYWWRAVCTTCKTTIDRHLLGFVADDREPFETMITEEVERTDLGKLIQSRQQ